MASWILVPCLVALREEFNALAPSRDKGADGSIGDTSHSASSSDHNPDETGNTPSEDADSINEVHALDIDSTGPWPRSFDSMVTALVAREKAEYESADVFGRLQNVIWNHRIASRSWGWTWRDHTGPDPHTNHAHFSARYTTAQENDTRPWGVKGDTLSAAEVTEIKNHTTAETNRLIKALGEVRAALSAEIARVPVNTLRAPYGSKSYPGRTVANFLQDVHAERDHEVGDATGAKVTPPRAGSPLDGLSKLPAQIAEVRAIVAAGADINEAALATALAPSLAPLILAGLPEGTLTVSDVEAAVRSVLTHGVG